MLATSVSISKIVVDLPKFKEFLKAELSFQKLLDVVVGYIKDHYSCAPNKMMAFAEKEEALSLMYDLRVKVLEWAIENKIDLNTYVASAYEKSLEAAYLRQKHPLLNQTLHVVYEIFGSVISTASFKYSLKNFDAVRAVTEQLEFSYTTLKVLELMPLPKLRYLKKVLDESLKLEIGLILSELINIGEIQAAQAQIEMELIPFLKDTIIRFGA